MARKELMAKAAETLAGDTQKKEAKRLFDYDTVTEQITKEASKGKQHLWIRQEVQAELRNTQDANEVVLVFRTGQRLI